MDWGSVFCPSPIDLVLGMLNSLDSSALFFACSDGSFVSVVGSKLFRPIVVRKMVFKQQHNSIS